MESRNEDSLYENPCYSASTSQQGSHDKSEDDCDIYESIDLKESTKQSPTLKNDEPTTQKNGQIFPCAVICAIAVLALISAVTVTLALSISNAIKLQSSTTTEGTSILTQQSQLTQNQLEEVKNDVLSAVQNLSVHFLTYKIAVNADLNQLNNMLGVYANETGTAIENITEFLFALENNLSRKLQNNSDTLNNFSMDLMQVNHTLTVNKNTVQNLSNNQSTTAEEVSNLMQQSQLTQNQLEEVKNNLALLQEAVHNIINNVSTDLEKITSTLTAYQYEVSNNFTTALQSFNDSINFDLSAIQTTLQQIISVLPPLECGQGSWRRLVYLNMSDPSQRCPPAWREYTTPVRSCGRPATNIVCAPSVFSTQGTRYSRVCGRIIGYQYGLPEAFDIHLNSITDHLADGISVVHGNPESHIWTFAAGYSDRTTDIFACPCANPSAQASPPFVGNNYFCESGTTTAPSHRTFYSDDPLWDGEGCVNSQCCTFNSPPWFNVQLPSSTTDDIEVRICGYSTNDEDTPVELIEIYVQ